MLSTELWKTAYDLGIIMNLDLAYSSYNPKKVHKYVGFGFSFHRVSNVVEGAYEDGNKKQINLNMSLGGNIEGSKTEQLQSMA